MLYGLHFGLRWWHSLEHFIGFGSVWPREKQKRNVELVSPTYAIPNTSLCKIPLFFRKHCNDTIYVLGNNYLDRYCLMSRYAQLVKVWKTLPTYAQAEYRTRIAEVKGRVLPLSQPLYNLDAFHNYVKFFTCVIDNAVHVINISNIVQVVAMVRTNRTTRFDRWYMYFHQDPTFVMHIESF